MAMSAHYLTGSNESDRDVRHLMRDDGVLLFRSGTSYRLDEGCSGAPRLDRRPFVAAQQPSQFANHTSPSLRSISVPPDHHQSRWTSQSQPPSPDASIKRSPGSSFFRRSVKLKGSR